MVNKSFGLSNATTSVAQSGESDASGLNGWASSDNGLGTFGLRSNANGSNASNTSDNGNMNWTSQTQVGKLMASNVANSGGGDLWSNEVNGHGNFNHNLDDFLKNDKVMYMSGVVRVKTENGLSFLDSCLKQFVLMNRFNRKRRKWLEIKP